MRDEKGVTVIEFALLAPIFFTIVLAIMETSVMFLASQIFESAVHDTSRLIRTGQAQEQGYTLDKFRTRICDRSYGLFDCSKIKVRVRIIADFQSTALVSPIDEDDAEWTLVEQFNAGVGKSIVVAEAYYKWDAILDMWGFNLANSADGTVLMGSARVWRNEPFS